MNLHRINPSLYKASYSFVPQGGDAGDISLSGTLLPSGFIIHRITKHTLTPLSSLLVPIALIGNQSDPDAYFVNFFSDAAGVKNGNGAAIWNGSSFIPYLIESGVNDQIIMNVTVAALSGGAFDLYFHGVQG